MRKILISMMALFTVSVSSYANGNYKKPVFQESEHYITCDTEKGIPFEMEIGKSEGKDLLYIKGWGRKFLNKTDNGFQDTLNNFVVTKESNGDLTVSSHVLMLDLGYFDDNNKKDNFYHSYSGYFHSHIFPNIEKKKVRVWENTYDIVETGKDTFSEARLYTEKNGRFSVLVLPNWQNQRFNVKKATVPDMMEFSFSTRMCKVK